MFARLLIGASLFTAIIGGCPVAPDSSGDLGDLTGSQPSLIGTGSSNNPVTDSQTENPTRPVTDDSAFQASLRAEFPECDEPARVALWRDRILQLVNQARGEAGLNAVRWNATLEEQATQYACELISYDFFAHVNPVTQSTLRDRANQFEYTYLAIGENLAAGQQTPEEAFDDWMNSDGHRANILEPRFTELGVGIRSGGEYGLYWVQEFGLPR